MKNSIFLIGFIMALTACHNKNVNMSEYSNSDKTITCKLPSYMRLTKESKYLIMFEGNQKIASIIWALSENEGQWDMERIAEQMLGKNKSKLTLVEQNDSLIAYEARSGNISLPASVFSLHEISGYSVLLFTMGFTVESHLSISDSIRCKPVKKKNEFKTGTTIATLPIRFSRGTGHRDFARRVPRRPVRTKIRHSLFYPRCSPLHTRTAIPQSVLDARHSRYHRFYHRIGLFCHTGLCYRFKAGQSRNDLRYFLRTYVRTRRNRFRILRLACR